MLLRTLLSWYFKKIVNSIYIILIKFNLSFIKSKNSFIITNKFKIVFLNVNTTIMMNFKLYLFIKKAILVYIIKLEY